MGCIWCVWMNNCYHLPKPSKMNSAVNLLSASGLNHAQGSLVGKKMWERADKLRQTVFNSTWGGQKNPPAAQKRSAQIFSEQLRSMSSLTVFTEQCLKWKNYECHTWTSPCLPGYDIRYLISDITGICDVCLQ